MHKSFITNALQRLLANAYAPDAAGQRSHQADVTTLRAAIRSSPEDAKRWRWLRDRIPLKSLHRVLDERFMAPDRAYSAEINEVLDGAMTREAKKGEAQAKRGRLKAKDFVKLQDETQAD